MQSVNHPIPRCVFAQNYLGNIRSNNSNSDITSTENKKNTEANQQYQDLVHTNGQQRNQRHEREDNALQTDSEVKMVRTPDYKRHYTHLGKSLRGTHLLNKHQYLLPRPYSRQNQKYHHHHHRHANLPVHQQYRYSTDENCAPEYQSQKHHSQQQQVDGQQQPTQHQEYRRSSQRYSPLSPLPSFGHNTTNANVSTFHRRHDSNYHQQYDGSDNDRHYPHCPRTDMNHLEAMFHPLHDPMIEQKQPSTTVTSPTAPIPRDHMYLKESLGAEPPSRGITSKLTRQHLLPPPILIPEDASLSQPPQQQHPSVYDRKDIITIHTQPQQLPSPAHSAMSPESPSSLAIHLYVHHHHHHSQPQPEPSPVSATIFASTPFSSDTPNLEHSLSLHSQPPWLLSPLSTSLTSPEPGLGTNTSTYPNKSLPSPLPSPPPLTPEIVAPSNTLESSQPFTRHDVIYQVSPRSNNVSPTTPTLDTMAVIETSNRAENDTASVPWLTRCDNLASLNTKQKTLSPLSPELSPSPSLGAPAVAAPTTADTECQPLQTSSHMPQSQPRRYRQYDSIHSLMPGSALANQLLSTISSKDLARLYVHAAYHLHSHQPIRRYVLMKMIMTQAEVTQYGRLRAEMPRAPGPSTGAQPKPTGLGSEARKGLSARPKVPSKLGLHVMTIRSEKEQQALDREKLRQRAFTISRLQQLQQQEQQQQQQQQPFSAPCEPIEGLEGWVLKAKSMIGLSNSWRQSLSKSLSLKKSSSNNLIPLSPLKTDLYSTKRFEELELGGRISSMKARTASTASITRGGLNASHHHPIQASEDDGDPEIDSDNECESLEEEEEGEGEEKEEEEEEGGEQEQRRNHTLQRNKHKQRYRHMATTHSVDAKEDVQYYILQNPLISAIPTSNHSQYRQHHNNHVLNDQLYDYNFIVGNTAKSSWSGKIKNARRRIGAISQNETTSSALDSYHQALMNQRCPGTSILRNVKSADRRDIISNSNRLHSSHSRSDTWDEGEAWSFTESYGLSGLLMVSLLCFFMLLLESPSQIHWIQTALLSIVL
ncbi:hypothetical protein BX616_002509 [Lobosporangium transversale]|nr:hypothetical protein BX616_002509 [Lobosporangium transversale]